MTGVSSDVNTAMTNEHLAQRADRNARVAFACAVVGALSLVAVAIIPDPHPWLRAAVMLAFVGAPTATLTAFWLGVVSVHQSRQSGTSFSPWALITLALSGIALLSCAWSMYDFATFADFGNWTR